MRAAAAGGIAAGRGRMDRDHAGRSPLAVRVCLRSMLHGLAIVGRRRRSRSGNAARVRHETAANPEARHLFPDDRASIAKSAPFIDPEVMFLPEDRASLPANPRPLPDLPLPIQDDPPFQPHPLGFHGGWARGYPPEALAHLGRTEFMPPWRPTHAG